MNGLSKLSGTTALTGMGYAYAGQARLQTVTGGPADIAFNYEANSSLLQAVNYGGNSSPWISRTLQHDFLNRLKQIVTTGGETHNYQYDALNRRTVDTLGDGARWDYSYTWLGQLSWAGKTKANGGAHMNVAFAYTDDWMGNPVSAQSPTVGNNETLNFTANKQNQLTSVPHSAYTAFIGQVNPNANISVQSSSYFEQTVARQDTDYRVTLNTGAAANDRYLAFTNYAVLNSSANAPDVIATGVVNLFLPKGASEVPVYDLDGNLTSDGLWTNRWNAENRLTSTESVTTVPSAARMKEEWSYLADGRWKERVVSAWNGSAYVGQYTNRYIWDGRVLLAVLDHTNGLVMSFMRGLDVARSHQGAGGVGGVLAINIKTNGTHFMAYDGNGNVVGLVSGADGTVSANYEYDPFGRTIRASRPVAKLNPLRFSTQYEDEFTGDLKYRYRDYQPNTGRWLSRDPIGESGGINMYALSGNDLINSIDPLGLTIEVSCPEEYFKENGITKEMYANPDNVYSAIGASGPTSGTGLILWRMLKTSHKFKAAGLKVDELKKHVGARQTIIDNALKANFVLGVGDPLNSKRLLNEPQKYFNELNNRGLQIGCTPLSTLIFQTGNKKSNQKTRHTDKIWIPGDWGYIRNLDFIEHPKDWGDDGLLSGENVFHTGISGQDEMFWGHFSIKGGIPGI